MPASEDDIREEYNKVRDQYATHIADAMTGAREFAQLALRFIVTINAGAAVAYPTVIELFFENLSARELILPTITALSGAVLGVICAYVAYLNYGYLSQYYFCETQHDTVVLDEKYDQTTYYTKKPIRAHSKDHWKKQSSRFEKLHGVTFYIAQVAGILSLLCFPASVIWFVFAASS